MKPARLLLLLSAALLASALLLDGLPLLGVELPALASLLWWMAAATLLLLAGVDALWLRRLPSPKVRRELPPGLTLQRPARVSLLLLPAGRWPRWLQVFDHVPPTLDFRQLPQRLRPPPGSGALRIQYELTPQQRGDCSFLHCEIQLPGPLGLWQQRRLLPQTAQCRVYPDFARLYGAQLSAVEHWLGRAGVRPIQRRGDGQEFLQLREFRDGDSLRHIDWKATARKRQPITREYCEERDQQILFLLDAGCQMRVRDNADSITHFDHALNACLLLAHVALRQGDGVGVLTFGGARPCFVPPAKGQRQLGHLLESLYDLQPGQQPGDLLAATSELLARQPRRALVVLITRLGDEDEQQLPLAVAHLARHHRLLITSLRENLLGELRQHPVSDYQQALAYCGSIDYEQARLHQQLRSQGLPLLDCAPGQLGPQLVNCYLQWKAAGTL